MEHKKVYWLVGGGGGLYVRILMWGVTYKKKIIIIIFFSDSCGSSKWRQIHLFLNYFRSRLVYRHLQILIPPFLKTFLRKKLKDLTVLYLNLLSKK